MRILRKKPTLLVLTKIGTTPNLTALGFRQFGLRGQQACPV